jgi:hypothetical protein
MASCPPQLIVELDIALVAKDEGNVVPGVGFDARNATLTTA